MICVLLAGGQQMVRDGLRRILSRDGDLEVAAEASSADDAVHLARRHAPDVVLLDIDFERASGLAAIAELRAGGARVVVLSSQDDPVYAREALHAGAQGYVLTHAANDLPDAIRSVLRDGIYVRDALAARLAADAPGDPLSERELEVLTLIALGNTNREIAAQLFLSVRTVEAHRRRILNKLRLNTRADLVRYAIDHHLVEI